MKFELLHSAGAALLAGTLLLPVTMPDSAFAGNTTFGVAFQSEEIDGMTIAYREAGNPENPTVLLLHGFPTSSHMFRNLIPALADKYHLVAPDYPGYGYSSMPSRSEFEYSFDNLANVVEKFINQVGLKSYSLYLMDYGAPIGFRVATRNPERVESLIIQNGNAYEEGLDNKFWAPIKEYWANNSQEKREALAGLLTLDATKWQYTHGVRDESKISPDTWDHVQPLLDRSGNQDIQLDLFLSYGTNPALYPKWQEYMREHQPPALIVWGKNDEIFPDDGAYPYKRDLPKVDFNILDTGHFALEEDGDVIADHIKRFLS